MYLSVEAAQVFIFQPGEVYFEKRDTRSPKDIMEIDVGANLACRYFSAKNSNPAGK